MKRHLNELKTKSQTNTLHSCFLSRSFFFRENSRSISGPYQKFSQKAKWKLNRKKRDFGTARDSFYCLYWNTFRPAKHDIHKLETKDSDAKVSLSAHQVCVVGCIIWDIYLFGNRNNYSNHNRVCYLCGESRDCTLTVRFVADEVYLFLRKPDKNCRRTLSDSHEATAKLEVSILSEQLQENEQHINQPTQEEDTAAYTSLDHSNMQEGHVYDVVIPRWSCTRPMKLHSSNKCNSAALWLKNTPTLMDAYQAIFDFALIYFKELHFLQTAFFVLHVYFCFPRLTDHNIVPMPQYILQQPRHIIITYELEIRNETLVWSYANSYVLPCLSIFLSNN